ncbi:hypothetical protein RMATCC62417_16529 [Rhizopus microsporus]|nr:hypothetical protein RMATCC62417_16529 [Rhizopus microsporus]
MDYEALIKRVDQKSASILGTAVASVATLWYLKRAIQRSKEYKTGGSKDIPTPKGQYFYLGHFPYLAPNPGHKMAEWHQELGPIYHIKIGAQDWVSIGDVEVANEIFVTKGRVTSGRPFYTFGSDVHGEGGRGIVFADYGKSWKNARTAILNILSPKSVESLNDTLQKESEFVVKLMIKDSSEGEVNPLDYTRLMAMNIMLATLFGISGVASTDDPLYKRLIDNLEGCTMHTGLTSDVGAYFPFFSFVDFFSGSKQKMRRFVDQTVRPLCGMLINRARESEQDCFIKKLDKIKESLDLDEQSITVLANELMVAGIDTSSLTIAWLVAVLCNHPEWQKKIAEEVDLFIETHGRAPEFSEREALPNCMAVIKEVVRYRPVTFFGVSHKINEDVVYKDYIIPKGTVLLANSLSMNMDPKLYHEPEKFKPERFLNDNRSMYASSNGSTQTREVFTFGWGRRICPGIYLAENEMFNFCTHLLAKCTIEPALTESGEKIYPELDKWVEKDGTVVPLPFKTRFVQRK